MTDKVRLYGTVFDIEKEIDTAERHIYHKDKTIGFINVHSGEITITDNEYESLYQKNLFRFVTYEDALSHWVANIPREYSPKTYFDKIRKNKPEEIPGIKMLKEKLKAWMEEKENYPHCIETTRNAEAHIILIKTHLYGEGIDADEVMSEIINERQKKCTQEHL